MIFFNIRYQFYRFLVQKKNKRVLKLEAKFINRLNVLQRTYWYKLLAILATEDLDSYQYERNIYARTGNVFMKIELYSNGVIVHYTHHDESSVHHTEIRYEEGSEYFFMYHYDNMLKKKVHKFMSDCVKIIDNHVKLEA